MLLLFAVVYFAASLPLFQRLSVLIKARRFTVRLGGPWRMKDPVHRWDVLMSFLSFAVALAASIALLDQLAPFDAIEK